MVADIPSVYLRVAKGVSTTQVSDSLSSMESTHAFPSCRRGQRGGGRRRDPLLLTKEGNEKTRDGVGGDEDPRGTRRRRLQRLSRWALRLEPGSFQAPQRGAARPPTASADSSSATLHNAQQRVSALRPMIIHPTRLLDVRRTGEAYIDMQRRGSSVQILGHGRLKRFEPESSWIDMR